MVLEIEGWWRTTVSSWDVASKICSVKLVAFPVTKELLFYTNNAKAIHLHTDKWLHVLQFNISDSIYQVLLRKIGKIGDRSRKWPESFFFNSYYVEV